MNKLLGIKQAASLLSVTPTTLRRWDADGRLIARRQSPGSHRYYLEDDIADFLAEHYKYIYKVALKWSFSKEDEKDEIEKIPQRFYCADSSIFRARLSKLEQSLRNDPKFKDTFSLVVSVAGEIGNNSFDHNIGNWPDVPGIFFAISLDEKKIILADRGQGVLTTLKRARPNLSNDKDALVLAFTKIISGRPTETRGNGLKYVKRIVTDYSMKLWFQSGRSAITINKKFSASDIRQNLKGCFAVLDYNNL